MSARLKVSRAGIDLLKAFEGLRRRAARLPDGRWTVGYGHTLSAREGAEVSEADAEALLVFDLLAIADAVEAAVTTPLTQNQFDALVAFAFNVGLDAFRSSEVLRQTNAGRLTEAAIALDAWRMADLGGRSAPLDPLVRRRAAEKALFLTPPGGAYAVPSALIRPAVDTAAEAAVPSGGLADIEVSLDGASARVRILSLPEPAPEAPPQPAAEPAAAEPSTDAPPEPAAAPLQLSDVEPEAETPSTEAQPDLEAARTEPPAVEPAAESSPILQPEPAAAEAPRVAVAAEPTLAPMAERPRPGTASSWGGGPLPAVQTGAALTAATPPPPPVRPTPPAPKPSVAFQLYSPYANIARGPLPIGRPAPREARSASSGASNGRDALDADPAPGGAVTAAVPSPAPVEPVVAPPLQLPPAPVAPEVRSFAPEAASARPAGVSPEPLILTPPPEYDPPTAFGPLRQVEHQPDVASAEEPGLFVDHSPRVVRHEVMAAPETAAEEESASSGVIWWLMAGVGVAAWSGSVAAFLRRGGYYGADIGLADPTTLAWILAVIGAACVATAAYFLLKRVGGVKD